VKRRVFNVLAAVSLVLCVATAALWVRSVWTSDQFYLWHGKPNSPDDSAGFEITHFRGRTLVRHFRRMGGMNEQRWQFRRPTGVEKDVNESFWTSRPGFKLFGLRYGVMTGGEINLLVPDGYVLLLTLLLPALWFGKTTSERNGRRNGACRKCGYDLRATPERCPECGSAVGPVA
jgi:hypothetical protein